MGRRRVSWVLFVLLLLLTPVILSVGGLLIYHGYDAVTGCGAIYPSGTESVAESDIGSSTVVEYADLTAEQQRVFDDLVEGENVGTWPEDRLDYLIRYQGDVYRIQYATSDCSGLYWAMIVMGGMLYLIVILSWKHAGPWLREELAGRAIGAWRNRHCSRLRHAPTSGAGTPPERTTVNVRITESFLADVDGT